MNYSDNGVLYDGVPDFMLESLIDWVTEVEVELQVDQPHQGLAPNWRKEFILEFDRLNRFHSGLTKRGTAVVFYENCQQRPDLLLNYTDFILSHLGLVVNSDDVSQIEHNRIRKLINDLDTLLVESGSKWRTGERRGSVGLVERVDPAMDGAADNVIRECGNAGDLLGQAWDQLFGRNPDPSQAYSSIVKAIESVTKEFLGSNDDQYTLGKGLRTMRDQHWIYLIDVKDKQGNTPPHNVDGGVIQLMMRSIWESHHDRHAGSDTTPISTREARAAIFLAVPIIQAFHDGLIRKPEQQS